MISSVTSYVPNSTPTTTSFLFKRDSSDSSDSSSASKTKSSDKEKCTGTKAQCQKPADHDMSVTIGVAVAIPVVVVIIFLGVILFFVYRRGKREALEDNDPDFDGDEYLNGNYPAHMAHYDNIQETKEIFNNAEQQQQQQQQHQQFQRRPPLNPQYSAGTNNNPFNDPYKNNNNNSSSGIIEPWEVNPFHLPGGQSDVHSLRTFAKEIKMDGDRGYNLASMSRHASQTSLELTTSQSPPQSSSLSYPQQPPIQQQEQPMEQQPVEHPLQKSEDEPIIIYDEDGEPISPAEEENIRRMKSIYKVYLDRNDTVRHPEETYIQNDVTDARIAAEPMYNETGTNYLGVPGQQQEEQPPMVSTTVTRYPIDSHTNLLSNAETMESLQLPQQPQQETSPINDSSNNRETQYRVASSIYSEMPNKPASIMYQQQPLPQFPIPQQQQQPMYPQQQMPMQQQQYPMQYPMQYSNPQSYIPNQRNHPQTLESIGELPPPARLAYSTSSHSLTSFRQPSKQLFQLQTARLNGTALNPMDHPEMFYQQQDEPFVPPNQYTNDMQSVSTNNSQSNTHLHPYQLRNSIVMTNPSELQSSSRSYRPAGSFRKFKDPNNGMNNSRNNSLMTSNTTTTNPYQQYVQSRVSGILEETDVLQPPSVPGILPHSGSSDDLRKQLGSSHNFNVSM